MLPPSLDKEPYSPVSEFHFTASKLKKRQLDSKIQGKVIQGRDAQSPRIVSIPPPTKCDIDVFYKCSSQNKQKQATLALVELYSADYLTLSLKNSMPKALLTLYDKRFFL